MLFRSAVRLRYLRTNPVCQVKMLPAPLPPRRVLTPEECQKLLKACPNDHWQAFVRVAVTTGMRRGELLALEWKDVDLLTGTVLVANKAAHATKSRKNRVTSTDAEGCRLLTAIRVDSPETSLVFGFVPKKFSQRGVLRRFGKIVEEAKIDACTLHDLRRTSLTVLASKLPSFALQQRAGHESPSTTAKFYLGDISGAAKKAADEAFEGFFSKQGEVVRQ